ncbi:hypothetical protein EZS27_008962 [termite gut metagenome]|uniref:Phospholipase D-like domain-containing protein n=1 Tax=termite gut metagenome TaxID=433724 RepID=A0A5J4SDN2_9ZZZZ
MKNKNLSSKFYNEFIRLKNISASDSSLPYEVRINSNEVKNVYFSADKLDNFIISQIKKASDSIIIVNAYFDWKPIADALIEVKNQGKKVVVLTDKSTEYRYMKDAFVNYNELCMEYLQSYEIEIYLYDDRIHKGIMH